MEVSPPQTLAMAAGFCHPKALGDRFIPGLTPDEWAKELDLLEGKCADAFRELERSGP